VPPPLRHQNTGIQNVLAPPRERFRILAAFSLVAFLQGASYATFALAPSLSTKLFPTLDTQLENWTLNCNNIAQALFIPGAIYMLRKRKATAGGPLPTTGLRSISIVAAAMQLAQSLLWCFALLRSRPT
jgi:hypothetical protein